MEPKADFAPDLENAGLPSRAGGVFIGIFVLLGAAALGTLAVVGTGPPNVSRYLGATHAALQASPAVASPVVAPQPSPPDDDVPPPSEVSPDLEFSSAVAPRSTELVLPSAADGHRVYVDGAFVGQPPSSLLIGCGRHVIQIGSRGRARAFELPCGERVALAYP